MTSEQGRITGLRILQQWFFASFPGGRAGVALLILRLIVGIGLIFHSAGKLNDIQGFATEFHLPLPLAWMATLTQALGGTAMVLGLLTPFASLACAGTMLVATITNIVGGDPFVNPAGHAWDNSALYLVGCLVPAMLGGGAFSLDALLFGWFVTHLRPTHSH